MRTKIQSMEITAERGSVEELVLRRAYENVELVAVHGLEGRVELIHASEAQGIARYRLVADERGAELGEGSLDVPGERLYAERVGLMRVDVLEGWSQRLLWAADKIDGEGVRQRVTVDVWARDSVVGAVVADVVPAPGPVGVAVVWPDGPMRASTPEPRSMLVSTPARAFHLARDIGELALAAERMDDRISSLAHALEIARVVLALGEVDRATKHEDGRPESDTTHTVMLAILVADLARVEGLDPALAVQFALVHDLAEAYAGDTCTARGLTPDERAAKSEREAVARLRVVGMVGMQSWAVPLLYAYERQDSPEARLVRYADKIAPKLTHILNGGSALESIGMSRADMIESHARQGAELRAEYPELGAVRKLFDAACLAAEKACLVAVLVVALVSSACTPLARSQGLAAAGEVACVTGEIASAAGEGWGDLVSRAGCWLADFANARADRQRDRQLAIAAERLRRALAAERAAKNEAERASKRASVAVALDACVARESELARGAGQ